MGITRQSWRITGFALGLWLALPSVAHAATSILIEGPDGGFTSDRRFGAALVLDGDLLYVGADGNGAQRVYQYAFDGSDWVQEEFIESGADNYGRTLSLDAGRLVVGAPNGSDGGLVEIYDVSGGGFSLIQSISETMFFGSDVALSGDVLAVAAGDGVRVYRWDGIDFAPETILTEALGAPNLALEGDLLVASDAYRGNGVVWTWSYDGAMWAAGPTPVPRSGGTHFGEDTHLAATTLMVSEDNGVVHEFENTGDAWTETSSLDAPSTMFAGEHIDREGEVLIVGDQGTLLSSGYATLWRIDAGTWKQELALTAGYTVSISGSRVALGRPGAENRSGTKVGEVEIFDFTGEWQGAGCATDVDCASGHCVDSVCCDTFCTTDCHVCSAAAGAVEDGECTDIAGPECCRDNQDCGEAPACYYFLCSEDNVCMQETDCCFSNEDCAPQPPCAVACVEGICMVEEGCEPDPEPDPNTGGVDGTGGNTSGNTSAATDGGSGGANSGDGGGCGCRADGSTSTPWWLAGLLVAARRRREDPGHSMSSGSP